MTKVTWIGNVFGNGSLAYSSREIVRALRSSGVDVAVIPLEPPTVGTSAALVSEMQAASVDTRPQADRPAVRFGFPRKHETLHADQVPYFEGTQTVWYRPVETDLFSEVKPTDIAHLSGIWAPSSCSAKAILKGVGSVNGSVNVVPHGTHYRPKLSSLANLKEFTFLSIADGRAWKRKGLDTLVVAFSKAFAWGAPVTLRIHSRRGFPAKVESHLSLLSKGHPGIVLSSGHLDRIEDLLDAADAYCMASRGEGFCLPLLDAMALGLPSIATAWGGHRDFATEATAELVPVRMLPSSHEDQWNGDGQWGEPSTEHLIYAFRRLKNDWRRRRDLAEAGATICSQWTWERAAMTAVAALESLGERVKHD